jgi:hypothetical protein
MYFFLEELANPITTAKIISSHVKESSINIDCETVLFAFIEFDVSVFTMMLRLFELELQILVSVINEDEELLTVGLNL